MRSLDADTPYRDDMKNGRRTKGSDARRMRSTRAENRVRKYADTLRSLQAVDGATRNVVMKSAKTDLILALVDCARAIIGRKVPLTLAQQRAVVGKSDDIKRLVNPRVKDVERRTILQKGGFLGALLGPIVRALLPALLGGR